MEFTLAGPVGIDDNLLLSSDLGHDMLKLINKSNKS